MATGTATRTSRTQPAHTSTRKQPELNLKVGRHGEDASRRTIAKTSSKTRPGASSIPGPKQNVCISLPGLPPQHTARHKAPSTVPPRLVQIAKIPNPRFNQDKPKTSRNHKTPQSGVLQCGAQCGAEVLCGGSRQTYANILFWPKTRDIGQKCDPGKHYANIWPGPGKTGKLMQTFFCMLLCGALYGASFRRNGAYLIFVHIEAGSCGLRFVTTLSKRALRRERSRCCCCRCSCGLQKRHARREWLPQQEGRTRLG